MCKAPILTTQDFTKTFVVECDASRIGIGVVPMQEGIPISLKVGQLRGRSSKREFMRRRC
jgi:hypothetical protein